MDKNKLENIKKLKKNILKNIIEAAYHAGASSAHVGGALSSADIVSTLFSEFVKIDPKNFSKVDRDYFILSKGHAALALYVTLMQRGFFSENFLKKEFLSNGGLLGGHPDKNIEKAISKTIAAYSNADGGVLIIGADDDGNVLGLESDYSTLEGDQDNFELHLLELIKRDFGPLFSKENIKINFHEIEDQEICQVQISKRIKPTYLEVTDKMGNKNKKFYIRSGNQSIEIQINEVTEYIKNRF